MRTVLLASLRTHTRRYVAAAIAVIVSVAFIVVIGVLLSGARRGLMDSLGAPFRHADHVIDAVPVEDSLDTAAAIAIVDRLGDNASGLGRVLLPARAGAWRGDTTVGPVAAAEALRWQTLVSGRFPERPGEAVVHVWDAQAREIAIGGRMRVGEGASAVDLRVVGLVEAPSPVTQASVYVTWPQYVHWRHHPTFHVSRVAVRGEIGPLPQGAAAYSPEAYVKAGLARLMNRTDAVALMMLMFAGIAVAVSVLVIANTFSILLAQRLRDFALLRCIGATRRQVLGSVRREAAVVGVLASLVGTLVGVGLGYGLIALINTVAPRTPMGVPELPAAWLLAGFVVGILVTAIASWLPARHVVRVSPLAALRADVAIGVHTSTGRRRMALAVVLLVLGVVLLGVAMIQHSTTMMLAGGGAAFTAVLLIGPVLVPRMVRIIGTPFGAAGRLATSNAVRNPRRTATTTAALLIGITVTTAMLTGMATIRAAVDETRRRRHPIDAEIISLDAPLSPALLDRVRRTPGVEQAMLVEGTVARISALGDPIPVVTAPAAEHVARDGGVFARVDAGKIRLDAGAFPRSAAIRSDAPVTLSVDGRDIPLQVLVGTGWGRAGVVSAETMARLTDAPAPYAIWIRAASNADAMRLVDDLDSLADTVGATMDDQLQARATEDQMLRILTWSVLGMLGVSLVIALIGIANTLGLAVLERAREHALLRALGLTRGQLRRMLAAEALLLSVVATLIGTAIGLVFAWVGHETFVKPALTDATLQIPWLSLGAVVLIAGLAGLLASVLPAHRAARVTPAEGLSFD